MVFLIILRRNMSHLQEEAQREMPGPVEKYAKSTTRQEGQRGSVSTWSGVPSCREQGK